MSCLVVVDTDYKLQYSQVGSGSVYFVTDPDHTGAFDTYQDPEKAERIQILPNDSHNNFCRLSFFFF